MPAVARAVRLLGQNRYLAGRAGIPGRITTPSLHAALSQAEATAVRPGSLARHVRDW